MDDLMVYHPSDLPVTPNELARFIVVAPERLRAVKAEINAIKRLGLAKAVLDQKTAEQAQLQELVLLASVRMGEIAWAMPRSAGGRPSSQSGKAVGRTKSQSIRALGLSTSQVGRMEQMALHPDIVAEVISESQAGQTEATQAEVLRRIKEQKNLHNAATEKELQDRKNIQLFRKATGFVELFKLTDEVLDSVVDNDRTLCVTLDRLQEASRTLSEVHDRLLEKAQARPRLSEIFRLQDDEDLEEMEPLLELPD